MSDTISSKASIINLAERLPCTDGIHKFYYPSGQLMLEYHASNGKLNGPSAYYDEDGSLIHKENYKDDLLDGIAINKQYFKTEGIWWEIPFQNNLRHGLVRKYDKDNQLLAEYSYQNGLLQGSVKTYQNGILKYDQTYFMGKRNGITTLYIDGIKRGETTYKNDVREGIERDYDPNGNLFSTRYYKNDLLDGIERTFETGIRFEDMYEKGIHIWSKVYQDDTLIKETYFTNKK